MSSPAGIAVAIVEDHPATREALVQSLADHSDRVRVVTAVADGKSLFASLRLRAVEVALVDLGLPEIDGIEVIRTLGELAPAVRAVALTSFDDDQTVLDAIRAGAHGYLLKDEPVERLVRSIEEAAQGSHPISSRVAGYLITHARRAPPPVELSEREEQLAVLLAGGLTYAECSDQMGIALGTVQDYVKRVYRKLDVSSKKAVREWVTRYATNR
jgi:DNA-binding NarL/FixJ family response regulator